MGALEQSPVPQNISKSLKIAARMLVEPESVTEREPAAESELAGSVQPKEPNSHPFTTTETPPTSLLELLSSSTVGDCCATLHGVVLVRLLTHAPLPVKALAGAYSPP